MKRFITVVFIATAVSVLAQEKPFVDPAVYPIKGLTSLELAHALAAVRTNLTEGVTIAYIIVRKSSVSVATIATQDGKIILGAELVFKPDGRKWRLDGTSEREDKTLNVGLSPEELLSLVRSFPLGPRILSIEVESDTKVTITTGYVGSLVSGHGKTFTYEKRDGVWKETSSGGWLA